MNRETRYLLSIVALAVLSHVNSIPGSFHYDDAHSIVENPAIRTFETLTRILYDPAVFSGEPSMAMSRPLVVLRYVVNYAISPDSVFGFILFNLLLHAGVSLSVVLLLRGWSDDLWAWGAMTHRHPINSYSQLRELSINLAALGVLFSLWFALKDRQRASWISYRLGLLAKSQAIVCCL